MLNQPRNGFFSVILTMGALAPLVVAEETDRLSLFLDRLQRVSWAGNGVQIIAGDLKRPDLFYQNLEFKVNKDGSRIDTTYSRTTNEPNSLYFEQNIGADGQGFSYSGSQRSSVVHKVDNAAATASAKANMGVAGVLSGYAPGTPGIPLRQLYNRGENVVRETTSLEGLPVEVIVFDTAYGEYAIFFASEGKSHPVRIANRKGPGDLGENGRPIDAPLPELPPGSSTKFPYHPLDSIEIEIDFEDVGNVNGGEFPKSLKAKEEWDYSNGENLVFTTSFEIDEADLDPNFEETSAFVLDAPDGTPAVSIEAPGVQFQTRKGALVPVVDESAIDVIESSVAAVLETSERSDASRLRESSNPNSASSSGGQVKGSSRIFTSGVAIVVTALAAAGSAVLLSWIRGRVRARKAA